MKLPRSKRAKRERFHALAVKEALGTITDAELAELEALTADRNVSDW